MISKRGCTKNKCFLKGKVSFSNVHNDLEDENFNDGDGNPNPEGSKEEESNGSNEAKKAENE